MMIAMKDLASRYSNASVPRDTRRRGDGAVEVAVHVLCGLDRSLKTI
jgi:hypothetical protein